MIEKENPLTVAIRHCASELETHAVWITGQMSESNNISITIKLKYEKDGTWITEMKAEGE